VPATESIEGHEYIDRKRCAQVCVAAEKGGDARGSASVGEGYVDVGA